MKFTPGFYGNIETNKMDSSLQESKGSYRTGITTNNVVVVVFLIKGALRNILSQCCKQREW